MIDTNALRSLFLDARTQNGWLPTPVTDDELRRVFDIMKMAPTSANTQPGRFVFLRTPAAKERLRPMLSPGNVDKTMSAPVVTIVAYDVDFHEHMPKVFPHNPAMKAGFDGEEKRPVRDRFAFRNGTLQGAYFMLAARAIGLDVGPMSGFDNARVDAEFFPDGRFRSNFLVNLGHGDPSKVMQRLPRFDFDEVCSLL
ncbi:MAG TPA: malonic semialdehyde reductase [Burkholderiaceae bacterium]|nr:malonic semialdehyde reductase [Burkholderiaceae bacterium]